MQQSQHKTFVQISEFFFVLLKISVHPFYRVSWYNSILLKCNLLPNVLNSRENETATNEENSNLILFYTAGQITK